MESTAKPAGLLPMQLQVGDRFTDEEGEWEIVQAPFTTRQGKLVHATIRQPGDPASTREKTWPAYERLTIERTTQPPAPKDSAKAKRSSRGRGKDGT